LTIGLKPRIYHHSKLIRIIIILDIKAYAAGTPICGLACWRVWFASLFFIWVIAHLLGCFLPKIQRFGSVMILFGSFGYLQYTAG
jgi:hypothetical protein